MRPQNALREVRDLIWPSTAGGNMRMASTRSCCTPLRLEAAGFEVMEGEEVTEKGPAVKGPDEIKAMRCAIARLRNRVRRDGGFRAGECAGRHQRG